MAEDLLWPTMAAAIPKILKSTYHSVQHKRKGDGADHSLQIILLFFLSPLRFLLFFYISAIPGFTVVLRHWSWGGPCPCMRGCVKYTVSYAARMHARKEAVYKEAGPLPFPLGAAGACRN